MAARLVEPDADVEFEGPEIMRCLLTRPFSRTAKTRAWELADDTAEVLHWGDEREYRRGDIG
jgi:hypothetical protein